MLTIYFINSTTLDLGSKHYDASITDEELDLSYGSGFWFRTYEEAEHEASTLKHDIGDV